MSKSNQQILKEYNKERKRVQQAIKRAEKKGYTVPKELLPSKPKKITEGSVRRLAKITPETIRKKSDLAQFQSELNNQILKDNEQRQKIKKESTKALKAIKQDKKKQKQFSKGEIVYRKLQDLISKYSIDNPKTADIIKGLLKEEFSQYGKSKVLEAIGQADEELLSVIEYAFTYDSRSPQAHNAFYEISMLIEQNVNFDTINKLDLAIEEDETWEDINESEWSGLFGG